MLLIPRHGSRGQHQSAQRESGTTRQVANASVHLQPNDRRSSGGRSSPIDIAALSTVMQQESAADQQCASALAEVARVMEVNGLLQVVPTMSAGPLKTQALARLTTLMAAAPAPSMGGGDAGSSAEAQHTTPWPSETRILGTS